MPHICCERKLTSSSGADFASASAIDHYAPNKVIEPIHLNIVLTFEDLSSKTLKGEVTITFKQNSAALIRNERELSEITLNAENFENVKVTGSEISNYRYNGHHIYLLWDTPFKNKEERSVTISYDLDDPIAGLYFNKGKDFVDRNPSWAITDHETEKARYWLPTVDFPAVRTTLTWSITAPEQYISLANGTMTSSETVDGKTTTKWELKYPCPSYLVCFAVGDFVEVDDSKTDGIPIKYYAAKGTNPDDLLRSFDKTPAMIQWLQDKIGVPFPWPKYYQICLPAIRGAMENISLVTWVEIFVLDETFALEFKETTDLVNIHEMGHTYFGDLLVIRHFDHAWLKESWATYIESCWLQDHVSEDAFRYEMYKNSISYFDECNKYMRPIVTRKYDSSWDMFDRHLYPGGSWRVHMLRQLLGDEAFWAAVKLYVERFSTKTVQTSDFQGCLEEVSGLNLSRYFDEWLLSKGYPALKGEYEYDLKKNRVKLVITQTQVKSDIPLFGIDLDVQVITDKNEVISSVVRFDQEVTEATFLCLPEGQKPSQVIVDPDFKVLFSLEMPSVDREVLIETAKSAKSVHSRIWAYKELVSSGSRPALKAVQKAIQNEPYYGVRVRCAAALAKLDSEFSLEILSQMIVSEQHHVALWDMLSYTTTVNSNIRQALLSILKKDNLGYRATSAALIGLGAQKNTEDIEYLLQYAQDETKLGQHGLIRIGALRALGEHRSEKGFLHLLKRVTSNDEPLRARQGAIIGLADSALWQTKNLKYTAIEVFAKLSKDEYPTVRMAAVEALIKLNATSYTGAVANTKFLYPHDDHSWFNRKIKSLKESNNKISEAASQKETIQKLEERIKKLENKLAQQEN